MKNRDEIQKKALDLLIDKERAGVGITMGGGKTLIGLKHMAHFYSPRAKFLVVAPKKTIFTEWTSQAEKYDLEHLLGSIDFTTYLSLPKQSFEYDVVYLDECHSLLNTHMYWLSNYKGRIVGLTGTPPRYDSSEKGVMVNMFCPIVYEYKTDKAVEDKILNDYNIIVHMLPMDALKTMKMEKNGKHWYTSEQESYNYWTNRVMNANSPKERQIMSIMRMKQIMAYPSKEHYVKKLMDTINDKLIIFANTQEQADKFGVASYHSNNPDSEENLEKFKKGDILDLACVLQLNEGVNIPYLRSGIIMHAYGNERKASQRIGRLLRLNPTETSTVHILCYKDTVDEVWVKQSLEDFDSSKITYTEDY